MPPVIPPRCRHRGEPIEDGKFECRSPHVVPPPGGVSAEDCRFRCAFVDLDRTAQTEPVVVPPASSTVAVAVLTAPRAIATIHRTVRELRRAGFHQPVHLFAEPGSEFPDDPNLVVTQNSKRLGLWDNWRSASAALLDQTDADFFLICEDDIVLCPAAAPALQYAIATCPHDSWGIASLYTARYLFRERDWDSGWQKIRSGTQGWGALAYCYSRDSLAAVLRCEQVRQHQHNHVDAVVPTALQEMGRDCWYHVPSLTAHAGCGLSTLGHSPHSGSTAVAFDDEFRGYVSANAPDRPPEPIAAETARPISPRRGRSLRSSRRRCDVVIPYCPADVRYLPVSVDSILHQNDVDPVLHLINDGVPDTDDLGRLFRDVPNVHLYRNDPGGVGPYVSTNRIVRFLETDFLAIQDADDIALPHRLSRAIQRLEQENADVYGAKMEQFIDGMWQDDEHLRMHLRTFPILSSGWRSEINPGGFILNGTMVIRCETFIATGGFANWPRTADCEFAERALRLGARPVFDDQVVARRRLRGDSLSNAVDHRSGTESNRRRHEICARRIGLYDQPGIDPRQWGGLAVEANGVGTTRLESVHDSH